MSHSKTPTAKNVSNCQSLNSFLYFTHLLISLLPLTFVLFPVVNMYFAIESRRNRLLATRQNGQFSRFSLSFVGKNA